jgi:hypothetical protein
MRELVPCRSSPDPSLKFFAGANLGLLLFGSSGKDNTPYGTLGGKLCVASPTFSSRAQDERRRPGPVQRELRVHSGRLDRCITRRHVRRDHQRPGVGEGSGEPGWVLAVQRDRGHGVPVTAMRLQTVLTWVDMLQFDMA